MDPKISQPLVCLEVRQTFEGLATWCMVCLVHPMKCNILQIVDWLTFLIAKKFLRTVDCVLRIDISRLIKESNVATALQYAQILYNSAISEGVD